ncbi:MAG: methyltransferase domain-containing protein [Synechococcales bacterium]|nr:methyltransferase domain-containing protein [Synechococcales bacterium]
MTVRKDTLFERFIAPVAGSLLVDREAMQRYRDSKDWEAESDRFRRPDFEYPQYYISQNFHGISGGYLTVDAAVTYDPITRYALPPNEDWVRQSVIQRIQCRPRRILDLGCGTGSTTLLLKRNFPDAQVIGLDLSPYMLVVADEKARKASLEIEFHQSQAEQTGFPDASFDLVTASLLFHELPPLVSCQVLQECFRLLTVGGEVIILDGNQSTLRHTTWLTEIFEEPYIKDYAAGSVDAWMGTAGFGAVRTDDVWWVQQVTHGVKPMLGQKPNFSAYAEFEALGKQQWVPG